MDHPAEDDGYLFREEVRADAVPLWRLSLQDGCPSLEGVAIDRGDWREQENTITATARLTPGVYRVHPPGAGVEHFAIDAHGTRHPVALEDVRMWLERMETRVEPAVTVPTSTHRKAPTP